MTIFFQLSTLENKVLNKSCQQFNFLQLLFQKFFSKLHSLQVTIFLTIMCSFQKFKILNFNFLINSIIFFLIKKSLNSHAK